MMERVEVTWVDSKGAGGWEFLAEATKHDVPVVVSVGVLLAVFTDRVVLAVSVIEGANAGDNEEQAHGVITIPCCSIRSMYMLELGVAKEVPV